MKQKDIKIGMLVKHAAYPGDVMLITGPAECSVSEPAMACISVCNGQQYDGLWIRLLEPTPVQPEAVPKYNAPVKQPVTVEFETVNTTSYTLNELIKNDPSGGEATHYSVYPSALNKYHKVVGDVIYFWYDRLDLPGYWKSYQGASLFVNDALQDAIALQPAKVKHVPTKKDYKAADVRMNAKFERRNNKINKDIQSLIDAQKVLKAQYSRKQRKVQLLWADAPV